MRHFGTLICCGLISAGIGLVPLPAKAQDADTILRLFNGVIAGEFATPRGEFRGRYRNDDDDDGYRRGRNDDDDDDDGRRRGRDDDDDDGGRHDDDDD